MFGKNLCRAISTGASRLLRALLVMAVVTVGVFGVGGCDPGSVDQSLTDITTAPVVTAKDRRLAGVYSPLDGVWVGEFRIFASPDGQSVGPARPREIAGVTIATPPLRALQTIRVRQEYVSDSPYFQRVTIRDTYSDAKGERTVESRGVNKIQNGRLWCVVKKPNETVIHQGSAPSPGVIIWERDQRSPLKIEYFHETVRANAYTIRGWGYYGKDDPEKAPRLWFLGEYKRIP